MRLVSWLILLLIVAVIGIESRPSGSCPHFCTCIIDENGLHRATCSGSLSKSNSYLNIQALTLRSTTQECESLQDISSVFPQLRFLYLTNCSLHSVPPSNHFRDMNYLEEVDFSNNHLTKLSPHLFSSNHRLQYVNIQNNPIQLHATKPFLISRSILEIDLSKCNITQIPQVTFKGLPNLRYLTLNDNRLKTLQVNTLPPNLKTLSLAGNEIIDVPIAEILRVRSLKEIDISRNPINCTCQLVGFQNWVSGKGVVFLNNILCSYPEEFTGMKLVNIPQYELCEAKVLSLASESIENNVIVSLDGYQGDQPVRRGESLEDGVFYEHDEVIPVKRTQKRESFEKNKDEEEGSGDGEEDDLEDGLQTVSPSSKNEPKKTDAFLDDEKAQDIESDKNENREISDDSNRGSTESPAPILEEALDAEKNQSKLEPSTVEQTRDKDEDIDSGLKKDGPLESIEAVSDHKSEPEVPQVENKDSVDPLKIDMPVATIHENASSTEIEEKSDTEPSSSTDSSPKVEEQVTSKAEEISDPVKQLKESDHNTSNVEEQTTPVQKSSSETSEPEKSLKSDSELSTVLKEDESEEKLEKPIVLLDKNESKIADHTASSETEQSVTSQSSLEDSKQSSSSQESKESKTSVTEETTPYVDESKNHTVPEKDEASGTSPPAEDSKESEDYSSSSEESKEPKSVTETTPTNVSKPEESSQVAPTTHPDVSEIEPSIPISTTDVGPVFENGTIRHNDTGALMAMGPSGGKDLRSIDILGVNINFLIPCAIVAVFLLICLIVYATQRKKNFRKNWSPEEPNANPDNESTELQDVSLLSENTKADVPKRKYPEEGDSEQTESLIGEKSEKPTWDSKDIPLGNGRPVSKVSVHEEPEIQDVEPEPEPERESLPNGDTSPKIEKPGTKNGPEITKAKVTILPDSVPKKPIIVDRSSMVDASLK